MVGKPRGRPRTISIARLRSASHSRASLSALANSAKTGVIKTGVIKTRVVRTGVAGAEPVVSKGLSKDVQLLLGRLARPEGAAARRPMSSTWGVVEILRPVWLTKLESSRVLVRNDARVTPPLLADSKQFRPAPRTVAPRTC